MAELRRRPPTGQVAYPIVLVVGEHKKGKSWETYNLANSDLIGEFFAFELGERTADEYAPLALDEHGVPRYEVIDHNGTYLDIFDQVKAATAIPQKDGKPTVISLDSGTALWDLHKAYADLLAKRTKRGRDLLANDPDAEIETQMAQWTATKDRWWALINHLRAWDGIAIITARIDVVAKVENGRPVPGQTTRSIQIEKGTPFQMSAVVEASFPHPARLTEIQSLNVTIPEGGLDLPPEGALEHVIFKILGAGGKFKSGVVVHPALGVANRDAKIALLDRAKQLCMDPETSEFDLEEAKKLAGKAWLSVGLDDEPEITTEQFEAVMAAIEPESDSAPPVEAEDETQVAPDEPEVEGEAEGSPEPADPSPEQADEPEVADPATPEPEVTEAATPNEPPADEEPAAEPEHGPEMVSRSDVMEVLNTLASTIASTPVAAETLVANVWIAAELGPVKEITQEQMDALVEAITAEGEKEPEAAPPADGAAEAPAEPPATPAPAKAATKKAAAKPAAPPTQESLIS